MHIPLKTQHFSAPTSSCAEEFPTLMMNSLGFGLNLLRGRIWSPFLFSFSVLSPLENKVQQWEKCLTGLRKDVFLQQVTAEGQAQTSLVPLAFPGKDEGVEGQRNERIKRQKDEGMEVPMDGASSVSPLSPLHWSYQWDSRTAAPCRGCKFKMVYISADTFSGNRADGNAADRLY